MQELRIKVQPSEVEMILGFISLLKKQGMFARVEPEIVDVVKKSDSGLVENEKIEVLTEENLVKMLDERMDSIKSGNFYTEQEFKNKLQAWRKEKQS